MGKAIIVVVFLAAFIFCHVKSLEDSLKVNEIKRFANVLQETKYGTLEEAFYVVKGLKALGKEVPAAEDICSYASSKAGNNLKGVFQLSEIAKALNCKSIMSNSASLVGTPDDNDVNSISYAIAASANFGLQVKDSLVKSLEAALKNDDSPASAANAFYAGSLLPKSINLKFLNDLVEDIVAQADEIDSSIMKFEAGLSVTSAVIKGALALADQQEKASSISEDQLGKFAQYFLNRKYVMDIRSIYDVASVLDKLSKNRFQIPIVVSIYKSDRMTDKNKMLKVRVTDVMDNSVADVKVTAKSVTSSSGEVVAENVALVNGPADDYIVVSSEIAQGYIAAHTHVYDFATSKRGIYTLNLNVDIKKNAKLYFGGKNVAVKAKVLSRVVVEGAEIGIADRDQANVAKPLKVSFPGKLSSDLEADYQQKIIMKFMLKDFSGSATIVHQAFVRMTNIKTGQEIFFVAQPENNVYKFILDIGATGKDSFNNLSGKYKMDLIIGDELVQIPIKWNIATVSISFADEQKKSKKEMKITGPQPEIQHMFRVPDKRPPIMVSNVFTALIIVPLVLMLALWIKIGANVSNFQFCISTIVFHIGLAGIFVIYYLFWTHLNMFQTLKGLAIIGGVTFLAGNKMLASMASRKLSKS